MSGAVLLRMAAEVDISSSLLVDRLLVQIRKSERIGRSLVIGLGRGHVVLSCVAQDELGTSHGVGVVSGLDPSQCRPSGTKSSRESPGRYTGRGLT